MKQIVCRLTPEMEKGRVYSNVPGYEDQFHHEFAEGFEDRVNDLWGCIVDGISIRTGRVMDAYFDPNGESDENVHQAISNYLKTLPQPRRSIKRVAVAWNELKGKLPRNQKSLHTIAYANTSRVAWRSLLDTITDAAVDSDEGQEVFGAEEWAEKCIQRVEPEYFKRLTGAEPEHIPFVIGRAALALVNMPLFAVEQPMIGLRSKAVTLRTVDSK